ncbi:hypothetical protein WJT74_05965 [Sphingomicrobium sp. XHP0239]|uniref:hypothetical protein n=1 Tax=Sphingomicrobium maritimum TaxID=3133972 RepID=UPI0031CC843B
MDRGTGGVSIGEIQSVVDEVLIPPTFAGELIANFLYAASKLANARREQGEKAGVTVFILSDSLPAMKTDWPANSLLRNGHDPISGHLILTNSRIGQTFCREIEAGEQKDLEALVSRFGFESLPTLVIDWRGEEPITLLYREGYANPDLLNEVFFFETEIEDTKLKEVLDGFYETALRTPQLAAEGNKSRVWSEASKGVPVENTEKVIQGELVRHLNGHFGANFQVRPEVPNTEGRADVYILEKRVRPIGGNYLQPHWQLELKALREKTSGNKKVPASKVAEAVEEGLSQAIRFREALHANKSALCCYDMRGSDFGDEATFEDIFEEANDNEIRLWRWFLYRSARASRKRNSDG